MCQALLCARSHWGRHNVKGIVPVPRRRCSHWGIKHVRRPLKEGLRNICGSLNWDTLFEGEFGITYQHFKYVYFWYRNFISINLNLKYLLTYTNIYLNVHDKFVLNNEMSENKWPPTHYTEMNKLHFYVLIGTTIQVSNSKTMQSISFMKKLITTTCACLSVLTCPHVHVNVKKKFWVDICQIANRISFWRQEWGTETVRINMGGSWAYHSKWNQSDGKSQEP